MSSLSRRISTFVVFGIAVTLVLSIYADVGDLLAAMRRFEWWLFPVVLGLTFGNQVLRYVKWEYLLRYLDIELPVRESAQIFGSGLIMIMTPGKMGEVWKAWLVREVNGTDIDRTMSVVFAERLTDLLAVAAISSLGVFVFRRSVLTVAVIAGGLVVVLGVLLHEPTSLRLLGVVDRLPVAGEYADQFRSLYRNSRTLLEPRPLLTTVTLSLFSWGLECLGMWLVLRGFGIERGVLLAAFVFAFASILGAVSLLPGGLGVAEGSMTGLLLLFGIERSLAVSTTLVIRAATLWFVALGALLIYSHFRSLHAKMLDRIERSEDR